MGRFESAAETYAAYRQPYGPAFFAALAERLKLTKESALLDLG